MAQSIHSSMGGTEIPPIRWSETYEDSTVLVAMLQTPASFQELDPDAQLEWYHSMASRLDDALLPVSEHVWKVQTYTMPYYCLVCPDVNLASHADHLVSLALDLRYAAQKPTSFEQATPSVSIGICSGHSAVGLIGQDGLSFYLTGRVIHTAKQLAEEGHQLAVHESTWLRMGDRAQSSYTWQRVHSSFGAGMVYVAVQPVDGPVGEDDHAPCYLPDLHCMAGAAPYPGAGTLHTPRLYAAASDSVAAPGHDGGASTAGVQAAGAGRPGQPSKGDTVYVDDVDSAWYGRSRAALLAQVEAQKGCPAPALQGCTAAGDAASGAGSSKAAAGTEQAPAVSTTAPQDGAGVFATLSGLLRQRWGS